MDKEEIFSEEYASDVSTDSTKPESEDVAKKTEQDISEYYNVRKPKRITIRAQVINDRSRKGNP